MGPAVVLEGAARGCDHDLVSRLRDGEGAQVLPNVVVRELGGAIPVEGVAVLAGARIGLAAGGDKCHRIAVRKATHGARSRKRRAVVDLAGAWRNDRE